MSSDSRERGEWSESVVAIRRCAAVVKGGRRFSFNALVVVGNSRGQVAWGYGKANEVPPAVEKGVKDAHKQMNRINLRGGTIPHRVIGRFGAARVVMLPASPGTGVIAGGAVRAVVQAAGVTDILTKSYGSTNKLNLVKAAIKPFVPKPILSLYWRRCNLRRTNAERFGRIYREKLWGGAQHTDFFSGDGSIPEVVASRACEPFCPSAHPRTWSRSGAATSRSPVV